ncbi:MAG: hypothetical protein JW803_05080 [Endomicrobiales bacterium]|nr:hypothetical protein [Endomicrobiales bacterium]
MKRENLIKKLPPAVTAFFMVVSFVGAADAQPKKDVSDPVLQEVISSFSSRMPRFIGKHGDDIFVADGPVNRGSLLYALYEYDRSLRLPRKDYVSKLEFEEFRQKIENDMALSSRSRAKQSASGKLDIMEVINDLQPNMPILLDNSLNNSKVFNQLKAQVRSGGGGGDVAELERRISRLEGAPSSASGSRYSASGAEISDLRSRIKKLEANEKDIAKLERRVDELSRRDGGGKSSGAVSEVKGYTSSLVKISLGLSMVAALFIAR